MSLIASSTVALSILHAKSAFESFLGSGVGLEEGLRVGGVVGAAVAGEVLGFVVAGAGAADFDPPAPPDDRSSHDRSKSSAAVGEPSKPSAKTDASAQARRRGRRSRILMGPPLAHDVALAQ